MGLFENLSERPPDWELNPDADLAQGLVFFGGGRYHGTAYCDDASGRGNHGTLTSMDPPTAWVWDGVLNRWSLTMDGNNDHVLVSDSPSLDLTDTLTVACWVRSPRTWTSANNRYYEIVAKNSIFTNGYGLAIYERDAVRELDLSFWTRAAALNELRYTLGSGDSVAWSGNVWHHLAGVSSPAGKTVYYDGVPVVTGAAHAAAANTGSLYVGDGSHSSDNNWIGDVSDALVCSRALSPAEIAALADPSNVMLSGLILPPRRRMWGSVVAATTIRRPWQQRYHRRMTGAC